MIDMSGLILDSELFTAAWASAARAALARNDRVRRESHWFRGRIRLASPERSVLIDFTDQDVVVTQGQQGDQYRFGFEAPDEIWMKLLADPRASLNRLVRSGETELVGDRVGGMQWWRLAYLVIEALSIRNATPTSEGVPG